MKDTQKEQTATKRIRKEPRSPGNGGYLIDRLSLEAKASAPNSALPRPFLRWVGSKRRLLNHIIPILPREFRKYFEPFLGSGALFFLLCPKYASLSDKTSKLIDVYITLGDNVSTIIRYLRPLKPDRDLFYAIRNRPSRGKLKRVAEFIYLNKTCWNGLYRVNSEGRFNVPYGKRQTEIIVDLENLQACSQALKNPGINLRSCDFEVALAEVGSGDLVYLDPPYVTRHNNNRFINYNETIFSWDDQKRLAEEARRLVKAGAYVIVTNAYHKEVLKLYPGFKKRTLMRVSTLASDPKYRGPVKEAILYSPNCIDGK